MTINKYDIAQVTRDYEYYKKRDNASDESIYFMLSERYNNRYKIASKKLTEALEKSSKEQKGEGQ